MLTEQGEAATDPLSAFEEVELHHPFGEGELADYFPGAQALVDATSSLFEFFTAPSGTEGAPVDADAGAFGARLASLETCFQEVQRDLRTLLQQGGGVRPGTTPSPTLKATSTRRPSTTLQGMDPAVVRAAQEAGIPQNHLEEMAKVMSRSQGKMRLSDEVNKPKAQKVSAADPLDDDDYLPEEAAAPSAPSNPMEAAILRLTDIASQLAGQKKKDTSLEAILDASGGGSGSQDSGGGTAARRNAAALLALKERLTSKPQEIAENIEKRMLADFALRSSLPGCKEHLMQPGFLGL